MFCKLIVLAACAVAVFGQAHKYPAGVNPHSCPNYPYCDNNVVALYSNNHHHTALPNARQYPAGVDPHSCPNYPYCDNKVAALPYAYFAAPSAHHYAAPVAHHYAAAPVARQYPAGVSPHTCPNYPYCH